MVIELKQLGLHVDQQVPVFIRYRAHDVGQHILDLLVEKTVIVELKTAQNFDDVHFSIVRSYLKAMNLKHGLLLNFARTKLDMRRVICEWFLPVFS